MFLPLNLFQVQNKKHAFYSTNVVNRVNFFDRLDWTIKAVFDSRKKRCTGKFKIFELSKRNQDGAQRSSRLRNKFSTANQIAGKKLLFLSGAFLRESKTALIPAIPFNKISAKLARHFLNPLIAIFPVFEIIVHNN